MEIGFAIVEKFGVHRVHREVATSWEFRSISFGSKIGKCLNFFEFVEVQSCHRDELNVIEMLMLCMEEKRPMKWSNESTRVSLKS